jgi:hypothetical protein
MFSKIKLGLSCLRKPSSCPTKIIKAIADGKLGSKPKAIYWALEGKKTWISAGIGVAGFALDTLTTNGLCAQCAGYSSLLYTAAVFLAGVGLYDGAVRAEPPKKV